jgi:rhodanese-related sulfurtransferase
MSSRRPGEPLPRSAARLVEEASAAVTALSPERVAQLLDDPDHLVVDIRDPRELEREGIVPGAYRAPRGMLEFWVDPESPYYKPALDDGRTLVLYCGSAWRSALAAKTLHDMGREDVVHLEGGFTAWKAAGLPVEPYAPRH